MSSTTSAAVWTPAFDLRIKHVGGQVECLSEHERSVRKQSECLCLWLSVSPAAGVSRVSSDIGPLSCLSPVLLESSDGKYITAPRGNCRLKCPEPCSQLNCQDLNRQKACCYFAWVHGYSSICLRETDFQKGSRLPASLCSFFLNCHSASLRSPPVTSWLCVAMDIPERVAPAGNRFNYLSLSISIRECGRRSQSLDNAAKPTLFLGPSGRFFSLLF